MALQSYTLRFFTGFSPPHIPSNKFYAAQSPPPAARRRAFSLFTLTTFLSFSTSNIASWSKPALSDFVELPNSGGVKALDLRIGEGGETPSSGDTVVIHYYGRLGAKQGWRFDSTYDHKDENGDPLPFQFVLGSGKVIPGIESAVRSMKVGAIRRVIIPPSQGYQNTSQEPIPPNFFDRQRLFTTIFNPTRLANGEGSALGILIFDIELRDAKWNRFLQECQKWSEDSQKLLYSLLSCFSGAEELSSRVFDIREVDLHDLLVNMRELMSQVSTNKHIFHHYTEMGHNNRAALIYASVARGMPPVVVAEYTAFSGNFNSIAYQCLQKLPSSNNKFTYNCDDCTFNYMIHDGLIYCVVAEESVGRQIPMAFLEHIKDDFTKKYGSEEATTVPANGLNKEYGSKLKEHMQYCTEHPEEISKLAKVKAQVSEVKDVMLENIEKILDRGAKIEILVDKTENLHQQAREFKSAGTKLQRKMWLQNSKTKLVVLAIVIVLILIIVLSVCGGFDCGK